MNQSWLNSQFSLEGKTAVVTGANRGIGLAIAAALAKAGANIVGVNRTLLAPESNLHQATAEAGVSLQTFACDFADRKAVEKLAEDLAIVKPDILVNNGGTIRRAPAVEHPLVDFDEVMDINLRAAWVLSRAVAAGMIERGSGKIVNIASMLSFQGGINVPGYTSSKHAILGLTRALANEWAKYGINVNAVAPGYVATDNTDQLRADATRSAEILGRIPAGRWAQADDIAGAVLFLCSSAAAYVDGAVLPVDGGWLAR